jgi:hypothetical protein
MGLRWAGIALDLWKRLPRHSARAFRALLAHGSAGFVEAIDRGALAVELLHDALRDLGRSIELARMLQDWEYIGFKFGEHGGIGVKAPQHINRQCEYPLAQKVGLLNQGLFSCESIPFP